MALVLKDRVRVTSSTTGTGTFTLGAASAGYQDFSVIGDGNTTYYAIQNSGDNTWEVGIGTYTSSGTTLSRDTILESSNGGTAVNFAAGTKDVFVTYPAEKGLYLDASGNSIGLGTPASATLTNATGLPISTGVSGLGSGIATFLTTPSSANLATAVTDETGSGSLVFATSPTLVTPVLGTPSSGDLTSCTGYTYANLSGTVPTWNQNTTGTAAGLSSTLVVGSGGTGTSTAFTTGSVVFAGASGTYSQDNANFFWDDTNNRLGIGTAVPDAKFVVESGTQFDIVSARTTTNILARGTGTAGAGAYGGAITFAQINSSRPWGAIAGVQYSTDADQGGLAFFYKPSATSNDTVVEGMRLDAVGNVGIGTTSPGATLNVIGTVLQGNATNVAVANPVSGAALSPSFEIVGTSALTTPSFVRQDTSASPQAMVFAKSRGSVSSPTVVASADVIGRISFQGYDGANFIRAATIDAAVDGTPGTTDMPGRLTFSTTADGASTSTERMRIDSSGNVGIGTTSTPAKLNIAGGNVYNITTATGSTGFYTYNGTDVGIAISSDFSGPFAFFDYRRILSIRDTNASYATRLTIDSSGNVGIGTSSPTSRLSVSGTVSADTGELGIMFGYANSAVGSSDMGFIAMDNGGYGTSADMIISPRNNTGQLGNTRFYTAGSERMRIDSSGNVGIGTTSAATKLQVEFSSAGTTIAGSPVFTLKNTSFTNSCVTGVVAQNSAGGNAAGIDFINVNQVADGGGASGSIGLWTNSSGTKGYRIYASNTGEVYISGTTDNGAYNLQCNGTGVWGAGAYVNGSDARIKENIVSIDSGLDVVAKLNPVTYKYKEDWSKDQSTQTGFIAQELLVALEGKNYVDGIVQQGGEYMSVAYQNIIPLLTKAIQELSAKVEALEAQLQGK